MGTGATTGLVRFPGFTGRRREGAEGPEDRICREVLEEFDRYSCASNKLVETLRWIMATSLPRFFFAGQLTTKTSAHPCRDEGQTWTLMNVAAYFELPDAIRPLQKIDSEISPEPRQLVVNRLTPFDGCRPLRTSDRVVQIVDNWALSTMRALMLEQLKREVSRRVGPFASTSTRLTKYLKSS